MTRALALSLLLALCAHPLQAAAQAPQAASADAGLNASEERVKAAFLYKFPNYVEWPAASFPASDSPYFIGVIGNDTITDDLMRMSAGRTIKNRPIVIKPLDAGNSLNGIHVLYISKSESAKLPQLLKQASLLPILIVTETEGALAQGSMINFRVMDDRMRFEISLEAAEKSGLKLSSRLLAIALSVIKGPQK